MIFPNLESKCLYYRGLTDYRLMPNGYILVMIDGKNFSTLIKNKFERPFDDWFIETMNLTAIHLCKKIQNVVGVYVQSDEISLVIKDNTLTSMPFDGRLCKLLSIIPSTATAYFNKLMIGRIIKNNPERFTCEIQDMPDYVFDCKVWSVPNANEAMAWFLYRQIDCIKNSKNQFCQTYLSHEKLLNLDSDAQVQLCIDETGKNWNDITDDKKYGRILHQKEVELVTEKGVPYTRKRWHIVSKQLTDIEFRNELNQIWFADNVKKC